MNEFYEQASTCGALNIDENLVNNIKYAESSVSINNPFAFYEINFSQEEVDALESFRLNTEVLSQFENMEANSTSNYKSSLDDYFNKISLDDSKSSILTNLVDRIFTSASSYNTENEISLLDIRVASSTERGSKGYPGSYG